MRRSWTTFIRRETARTEARLRAARPQPSDAFVALIAAHVNGHERRQAASLPRLAAALVVVAGSLAAFAGFGGLSYAASAAGDAFTSVKATVAPGPSHHGLTNSSPAGDQYGTCSLGDYVWLDRNGNGIQDDGAANGVDGVLVELLHGSTVIATDVTAPLAGAPGFYLFTELACGHDFRVRVAASNFATGGPLEGKLPTTANVGSDALDSDGDATSTSPPVQSGNPNLTVDFGYLCPVQICPDGDGFGGNFYTSFDADGNLHLRFTQFTGFNDNSYGANAVGWGTKGHTFGNLTGSDQATFAIKNAAGTVVLQFSLDYLTCQTSMTTPSKCRSLGPTGGDGGISRGQLAWILDWDTSLDRNLNDLGFCSSGTCVVAGVNLKVDSPPTTGPSSYDLASPAFTGWEFANVYEATISKAAWGPAGFGGVSLASIHNSPSKPNATCPGTGGGLCSGDTKLGSLTLRYTGEPCQSPLPNPQSGKATCTGTLDGTQPVRIVATSKDGKKTYFDSGTPADVNIGDSFQISAAAAGQARLDADTLVTIYDAGGTVVQTVKFHTSCSQLIAVGDRFGALEITGGTNVPK